MPSIARSVQALKQVTALLTVFLISAGFSLSAIAHTALHHSIPKANAEITTSPEVLELGFANDVRLLKLNLLNGANKSVDFEFVATETASKVFSYDLPELGNGTYKVDWSILGGDGHRISQSFSFTVNKAE